MPVLKFSVSPEATGRIYELLQCLAKFGEAVSLEAGADKLTFTAINSSRTAYASFALGARIFFLEYDYQTTASSSAGDLFTCQLYNRALQAVFKNRASDARGRETAIDRCDVTVQDEPDRAECRIIVKMLCRHGMTKTYRLTYESTEIVHALFDKRVATQGWKVSARILREYIEFFAQKTEQLSFLAQEDKAVFTSFTEKIQDEKQVLKQPLETMISIDTNDFEDFHMQQGVHLVMSVKDFKAIVTHAETLRATISAQFSLPTRPLQFSYTADGMHCQFTLMTWGDYRSASETTEAKFTSTRPASRTPSVAPSVTPIVTSAQQPPRQLSAMPPPTKPASYKHNKPLGQRQQSMSLSRQASAVNSDPDPDSLFVPAGDEDDQTWGPPSYDEQEEDQEMLGWDAGQDAGAASAHPTFRDTQRGATSYREPSTTSAAPDEALEPTQRLSQLHGMFD
ncbi:hypothetical protein MBLNU230_g3428t1 [Neophaeotheca triangularis]